MKNIFVLVLLLAQSSIFAQLTQVDASRVGINTKKPVTSLDVNGKKDPSGNFVLTDAAGIMAPRFTREEITVKGENLYTVEHTGAIIYITDITGGNAQGQRINIKDKGYYYFDGEIWQKFNSEKNINIYNSNGTLTSARWINTNNSLFGLRDPDYKSQLLFDLTKDMTKMTMVGIDRENRLELTSYNSSISLSNDRLLLSTKSDQFSQIKNNGDKGLEIGTVKSTPIVFKTGDVERLKIDSNGNIGVGNIFPESALDVNGKVRIREMNLANGSDLLLYIDASTGELKKSAYSNSGTVLSTKLLNPDSRRTDPITNGILCTLKYKPISTNSKIIVEFNTPYFVAGYDGDEFQSELKINGSTYAYGYQRWDHHDTGGGGTRSGTLFPLQTQYINDSDSIITIDIYITRLDGDDFIQMKNPGSDWFKITEIAK
ncbi:hypothetical protein ABE425_15620 [Chryseobacterium cucumeris]|uniref:hypothetical protein n=1 Tax=Chryseobacterium TaxID=59732 RepID=UPI0028831AC1|nr:hypothetical protein [Chryseobacterium sp. SG20098]WNI36446.1 hypothetical protein RHP76_21260 [Chryseobacterium sp. SG20098]